MFDAVPKSRFIAKFEMVVSWSAVTANMFALAPLLSAIVVKSESKPSTWPTASIETLVSPIHA